MKVKVYQIADETDSRDLKFMNHEFTEKHGGVIPSDYKCVFDGYMKGHDLEDIYAQLNDGRRPGTFRGHSLSVSDVVEIEGDIKPNWRSFEATLTGKFYHLARFAVASSFIDVLGKDMSSFSCSITDPLSDWCYEFRNSVVGMYAGEMTVDSSDLKPFLMPLIYEYSEIISPSLLESYGWTQADVRNSLANHLDNEELQEYALEELSADDVCFDTQAKAVCDEVNRILGADDVSTIIDTRYVPIQKCGTFFCDSYGFKEIEFDGSQAQQLTGLRCLEIQPNKPPFETRIEKDLQSLQNAVSLHQEDSMIEFTYPFEDNAIVMGNEEAKLIGMEGNRRMFGSIYAGPLFIMGDDGEGGLCDLTDEQVQKYGEMFAKPEQISQDEVQGDLGFTFYGWN